METFVSEDPFDLLKEVLLKVIEEREKFENLTEEEIVNKIDCVKKNCFILQLKNEIYEKYLKRHNPGALRELKSNLSKEPEHSESETLFVEDPNNRTELKSKDLIQQTAKLLSSTEKQNIRLLIKIVEQEIAELCMISKKRKHKYDFETVRLSGELETYQSQSAFLEKILKSINASFPLQKKVHPKESDSKIQEFMKFMTKCNKEITVEIRKTLLEVHSIKSDYLKLYKEFYVEDVSVLPVDEKLLAIEVEKLENELSQDNQALKDLMFLLDKYKIKYDKETKAVQKLKVEQKMMKQEAQILDKRLLSLEKYLRSIEEDITSLQAERSKLKERYSLVPNVPTSEEYISQKLKLKQILKKVESKYKRGGEFKLKRIDLEFI